MAVKLNPIKRLNYVLIASIILGEALIMLILRNLESMPFLLNMLLDVIMLSIITIPVVWWTVTKLMNSYLDTITERENQMLSALNALATAKDNETGSHIIRTQKYVRVLATRLRNMGYHVELLTDAQIDKLVQVAPLHDLGKVGIPDHILKKRRALNRG